MFKKLFTVNEANRRLPLVKKIVGDILEKGRKLRQLSQRKNKEKMPVEYHTLSAEIESLMMELEDLGCFFKDWNFEIGLVDFPAKVDEKDVLLCWRSDEPHIRWYHPVEEGYLGRKLIPEDLL